MQRAMAMRCFWPPESWLMSLSCDARQADAVQHVGDLALDVRLARRRGSARP